MMRKAVYAISGVALLVAAPALAHHSFAMFDQNRRVEMVGTFVKIDWANPHVYFQADVKTPAAMAGVWAVEGAAPNGMSRQGWSRNTFKPGDPITMIVRPRRDGNKEAMLLGVKTPTGKFLWRNEDRPDITPTN